MSFYAVSAAAEAINELEYTDKAELVGRTFVITHVVFITKSHPRVELDVIFPGDEEATFTDTSSTGVKAQIERLLEARGITPVQGELIELNPPILAPRGLRVSTYDVPDPRNPKATRKARTYYLTTSGTRG